MRKANVRNSLLAAALLASGAAWAQAQAPSTQDRPPPPTDRPVATDPGAVPAPEAAPPARMRRTAPDGAAPSAPAAPTEEEPAGREY
jgi:hypothetical protein